MPTKIFTRDTLDIIKLLELANELFVSATWESRLMLAEGAAIQFYDAYSLLRFTIVHPLKLYFSNDESEGILIELEDLEIETIKEKLFECKTNLLNTISKEDLLSIVKEVFPFQDWRYDKWYKDNDSFMLCNQVKGINITISHNKLVFITLSAVTNIRLKKVFDLEEIQGKLIECKSFLPLPIKFPSLSFENNSSVVELATSLM